MRYPKKQLESDGLPKIPTVVSTSPCVKHRAGKGVPCWWVHLSAGARAMAVCNSRAKKAGFNAPISEQSLFNRREKAGSGKRY